MISQAKPKRLIMLAPLPVSDTDQQTIACLCGRA